VLITGFVARLDLERQLILMIQLKIEWPTGELVFRFALLYMGAEREILVLKVEQEEFLAFPPYAKNPIGPFDVHMTWHRSGERHFTARRYSGRKWRTHKETQRKSAINLGPPAELKGIAPLYHSGVFRGKSLESFPVGTNPGYSILLDADRANFREDFICIRAYLVEAGTDDRIPIFPDTGPRILYLVNDTTPWLAVEVCQQKAA
jgi:hypothetical protein